MKKWNKPTVFNLGLENTNEPSVMAPSPDIPGSCGYCNKKFENYSKFLEHETKQDGIVGTECEKAPTNGQYESIYIPMS